MANSFISPEMFVTDLIRLAEEKAREACTVGGVLDVTKAEQLTYEIIEAVGRRMNGPFPDEKPRQMNNSYRRETP